MTLINERIRYGQVRVVDEQNNQLGILDTKEALDIARSRDLGYTWGTYAVAPAGNTQAEKGFYVRTWSRAADGTWQVALDVLQPE